MPDPSTTVGERDETTRVEAFSDGVFAIAITLLVLEIRVPEEVVGGPGLGRALLGLWPSYLAFLTSFATIGIMWINHHRLFTLIRRCDHLLLVANGFLLLWVSFLPFPTAVVARSLTGSAGAARTAAAFFSGTFVVIAVAFNLLWRYASGGRRLLEPAADEAAIQAQTRQYAFGPVWYMAAFGLAFVSVPASLGLNLLLALFFALPLRTRREVGAPVAQVQP
jgi:uncharacterized membrane protein